ncbi:MAG: ribokinase [Muribaculaceae bacterium]|nr:ribokinase [Muribaculaceae bacterium]
MVVKVEHLPLPGETIIGQDFITNQGGKGANQAVAVSRMGGDVSFVARVGNDGFGKQALQLLGEEGIDTTHVLTTEGVSTGIAMIPVDARGENSIIVVSGANAMLSEEDIEAAKPLIAGASIVLMQLETPIPTLIKAVQVAHESGAKVLLNPAPFPKEPLPGDLLKNVDLITPNETEASMMSGVDVSDEESILKAIRAIQSLGVGDVIITAGSRGAYTIDDNKLLNVPAFKVKAVDTTAAGDTFNGALCVALSEGLAMPEAILMANKAASVSVTRLGAWRSIPRRAEL